MIGKIRKHPIGLHSSMRMKNSHIDRAISVGESGARWFSGARDRSRTIVSTESSEALSMLVFILRIFYTAKKYRR